MRLPSSMNQWEICQSKREFATRREARAFRRRAGRKFAAKYQIYRCPCANHFHLTTIRMAKVKIKTKIEVHSIEFKDVECRKCRRAIGQRKHALYKTSGGDEIIFHKSSRIRCPFCKTWQEFLVNRDAEIVV